jgi:hypothetical protein
MAKQKHDLLSELILEYKKILQVLMQEAASYKKSIDSAKTELKKDLYRKKLEKLKVRIQDLSMKLARLQGDE